MLSVDDMYYDRQGQPMTMVEWSKSISDLEYKRVAYDEVDGGTIQVSTVWLGLNHQYGDGPPLIFETMVFGGPNDNDCYRYASEEEALEGHKKCVQENDVIVLHEVRDRKSIES